ncbi:MAG: hypothetical protein WC213_11340 [Arenimonas sp.]
MKFHHWAVACLALCWVACASAQVDLDRYLKPDTYGEVKISPTGEYYALTLNLPDRQVLLIQRRADGKVTGKAAGRENSQIAERLEKALKAAGNAPRRRLKLSRSLPRSGVFGSACYAGRA